MTYEEMERLPVTDLAKVLAEIRMDKRFREYQHRCDEKWRAYARQRAIRRIGGEEYESDKASSQMCKRLTKGL